MSEGKLISADQGVQTAFQHTSPCTDCPFARAALPGWLGSLSVDEWLRAVHGESFIQCHVYINQQCAGAAIYRANVAKRCISGSILILPQDKTNVFATPLEFKEFHETGWHHDE
jgi:hypothetical protein